jgi:hypothetical protein
MVHCHQATTTPIFARDNLRLRQGVEHHGARSFERRTQYEDLMTKPLNLVLGAMNGLGVVRASCAILDSRTRRGQTRRWAGLLILTADGIHLSRCYRGRERQAR